LYNWTLLNILKGWDATGEAVTSLFGYHG